MRSLYRYSVLAVLCLAIIAMLGSTFSGPLIYSLKTDLFPSVFHENTDALKVESFNSTLDLLPLMQDLLDYTGPIVLNINIRDMGQVRYYMDLLSRSNIRLKNLVINLEMTDSEIEEFSRNKELQEKLLQELMNSTISLDELDSLMIRYRNDQNMLISIELQREALLERIHEILNEYRAASEKIQTISEKAGLDTTQEKAGVKELETMVNTMDEKVPQQEIPPVPRIPTLSLLVNPETGKYGDRIGLSGVYRSSTGTNGQYPVSVFVEGSAPIPASTDPDGIYKTSLVIDQISPGEHSLHAVSGLTTSEYRTLTVIPVDSATSLDIQPVFNRPEIVCSGTVLSGGSPVRNAPVDIVSDYHTILRQTSDKTGSYQARVVLSPGIHQFQAQFVNATYPLFASRSPVYLVEAGRDSILSIRLLDRNMSADELSLAVDPANASYKDIITITGVLSGRDPKDKTIDVFIDGAFSHRLTTRPDGSYTEKYVIEKMKAGTHRVFTRYSEPGVGEIYSEPRQIIIRAADSATSLDIEMTDGGTALICTGNVTARAQGVPSASVELVVDNRTSQKVLTDETGTFRQKMSLPAGDHSIFARFTDDQYPVNPSESSVHHVTVLPPIDLVIRPLTVKYGDTLTFSGSLRGDIKPGQDVQISIDAKKTGSGGSDRNGNYSVLIPVEKIPGGTHTAFARSGEYSTGRKIFSVTMVDSTTTLAARLDSASAGVTCSGRVMADGTVPVRSAPVTLIWDGENRVATTTDEGGRYETMLSLPAGNHTLYAEFNAPETYPIRPSVSDPVTLEIRNPVVVRVRPDQGAYRDVLAISGAIQGPRGADRDLELVIDGKKAGSLRSDRSGSFTTPYLIEQIPGGAHTLMVGAGDLLSEPVRFTVVMVDSATTLVAGRIGDTSEVSCSGLVMAQDKPVRSAPVYLIWDNTHTVETTTDADGRYHEILTLPGGLHTIKAQFNSPAFPIRASESATVRIDIPVKIAPQGTLVLEIIPVEGSYQDHLTIRGSLSYDQPDQVLSGKTVNVFIDGTYQGNYTTGANGKFTGEFIIDKIRGGEHILYGMTSEIESEPVMFTVIMVDSTTTLVANRIGDTSQVLCSGVVIAQAKPVRTAPVYLIWDDVHTVEITTDADGKYTGILTLPAGQHTIKAQFNSTAYPIRPSESAIVRIDIPVKIPQGTLALEIMPAEGRYQDHLTIQGGLSYDQPDQGLSGKTVNVFIDGTTQGRYTTDRNGKFTGDFIIDKIRGGPHILYGMTGEIESEPVRFTVVMVDSTTTLVAKRIGDSSEVSCSGLVMAQGKPVRTAPIYLIWDGTHIVETTTNADGGFNEILTLPAGQHTIKAQFNSTAYPIRPSESATIRIDIPIKIQPGTLPQGTLVLEIMPVEGSYQDHLTIRGSLSYDQPDQVLSGKTVNVFIDGTSQGNYTTGVNGKFTGELIIDKIRGGSHVLYGMTGEIESEPVVFTVVMVDSTTTLSVRNSGETSRVLCSGSVIANNKPVRYAPVFVVWDDATSVRTSTDGNGYYQETLALPAGKHSIQARFNTSGELPIYPSESAPVNVEIAPPLAVTIQPDQGTYREDLTIHGELHTETIARQEIQLFIDNVSYSHYFTDDTGRFTTEYAIENISSGLHTLHLRSGEYQSGILPFTVLPVNSAITLSANRTGATSLIECSGTLSTGDKPVRFAPVTIIWDNGNSLETFADENGTFKDTIILPAGKHRIQAFFNSSPLFPVRPSASTPVDIDIAPGLSLSVQPAFSIYHDTLRFEGTLIRPESVGETSVDIFIDDTLAATEKTGPGGQYSWAMTLERIAAGKHRATARSGTWSSDTVIFQVLPVRSQTTLVITPVNQSALYECNGTVMAFDHPGAVVQKLLTVQDAEAILESFWKNPLNRANRPVISAPVAIVSNDTILSETTTDTEGRFSALMSLPEGQNVIVARFVNDSYPIFSSQSTGTIVDTPSANLTQAEGNGQSMVRVLEPLAAVAILLLFAAGAGYYLKRNSILFKDKREPPESATEPGLPGAGDLSGVPVSPGEIPGPGAFPHPDQGAGDPIFARYLRILHAEGLSTAARTVYVHFTGTIAERLHIHNPQVLTPREFLQACEEKPFVAPVSSFIALYEQIRYGGAKSPEKQGEFEESIRTTDQSLEGEHE